MPVTTQHYVLLQRNLLYTGITRAKRLVVLVGSKQALFLGIKNNNTAQRYSYLAERIRMAVSSN
jgi:exodeoxyribonuclease V alpha subunit